MLVKMEWPDAYTEAAKQKWAELDWEKVKENWPIAPDAKPENVYYTDFSHAVRMTDEEITNLSALGFKLEVVPYPGAMVTKMQDRHKWEYDEDAHPLHMMKGQAVQVTVADMALLLINEVEVHEDMCTHELQDKLDGGWRVLAVCPPNAQRRPDYILGRVNRERKVR